MFGLILFMHFTALENIFVHIVLLRLQYFVRTALWHSRALAVANSVQ